MKWLDFRSCPVITDVIPLRPLKYLNPKKWNIITWAGLAFWAFIGVGNNIPFTSHAELPAEIVTTLPSGRRVAIYDVSSEVGFPFTYQMEWTPAKTLQKKTSWFPFWLAVNLLLVTIALAGVAVTVQTLLPRFSIRAFAFFTIGASLAVVAGAKVFSLNSTFAEGLYIYSLYFAPAITGIMITRNAWLKNNRQIAG